MVLLRMRLQALLIMRISGATLEITESACDCTTDPRDAHDPMEVAIDGATADVADNTNGSDDCSADCAPPPPRSRAFKAST